ncbi:MAG: phage tail tape measure protein, partial [Pedobacter sp.]
GLATGDFLADFGERVGGLAKQAGLSLPVILSYGAVLQENGVSAEVAGSAFKRLLSSLATNREKFFAVAQLADANLTLKDFTKTINTDSKKALDLFFAGLAKGGTTTTSFNDILKSLKLTGAGVSQTVAALSNGQAELNGHIEQATKDFDAATLSAEQYALKNDNLAGSWDKLGNTIRNAFTSGPVAGFFKVLIDGLNDATKKFIGITQSRSWMEFFTRITPLANTKGFDINNRISDNFKAGTSTSYDLNSIYDKQINGGGVSPAELKKAYNDAVAATKSALKDYQDFEKGLKSGDLKNTNGQLGTLANRFRYLRDQTAYFTDEYNKAKAKLPKDATVTSGGVELDLSGGKTTKAEAKKLETALNSQRVLQAKIDEQNDKGRRKQLDSDAQEIEAVKAKYAKLREEADRFNANKDNKKRGLKVDASGLVRAESTENDALVDKQAAVKLKVQLDDQKKLYEEFEQFKLTFGEAKAKERYKIEGTYLQYLADQQAKILGYDEKAKGGDAGGGSVTTQQAKVLEEANKQALEIQQKRTDALLKEFMGYAEKRKVLIQNYEKDYADLESNPAAQAERTKRYNKDLHELDDANAKKLDSYQTLFEGIESLSQKQALKVLQAGRAALAKDIKSGAIVDPAEIAKVKKYFDDVEVTIREGSGQALM